ncbi:uncharacterized protein LOC111642973 [Copidosoma floridanum]|uniref:uncharacterized protein LOC111642973 n=1 Tax=Copidosoma floridanum TaxID=29053 RepID=UPI000C6F8AF6|nr:uncharacterized protein LOC111642973 [Copidosoma floridanum]
MNNFVDSLVSGNESDQIPDLVTKVKLVPSYPVLEAGEVIVGNIHPRYGVGYMLHLFENYEPIAISFIKVTSNSELRYCHVYFKNLQDSIDVEENFDKYKLAGRNLIVARPSSLLKEAHLRKR